LVVLFKQLLSLGWGEGGRNTIL